MLPDYYKVFGLKKSAKKDEIKKRYRDLAKIFPQRPDSCPHESEIK